MIFLFQVEEVLLQRYGPELAAGQSLEVARANWRDEYDMQLEYCREGLSQSPIYRSYTNSLSPDSSRYLAFLGTEGTEWKFACDGAEESLERKQEVLRLIHNSPAELVAYPDPD